MNFDNDNILISVIIPIYNAEKFLKKTIVSVLEQTYQNFEIICINDCSTDKSLEIIKEFSEIDVRVKVFNLQKNLGCPGLVRNYGVKKSKGKMLAFLDADDIWKKNKLEKQLRNINNLDNFFSYTKIEIIMKNRVYEPKYYLRFFNNFHIGNLLIDNTITTSTVVMSKKLFNKVGGFRNKKMVISEDYELWIKAILEAKEVKFVDEILVRYYINLDSITNSKIKYRDIYLNILSIIKQLLESNNLKFNIFAIVRLLTLPLLLLYHLLIKIREFIYKRWVK